MNQKTDNSNDAAEHPVPDETLARDDAVEPVDPAIDGNRDSAEERPQEIYESIDGPVDERLNEALDSSTARHDIPPAPRRGVSTFVAWLALLLALLALAGSGYLAWQSRASSEEAAGTEAAMAALSEDLDEAVASLQTGQRDALADLEDAARQRAQRIDSLERELEKFVQQQESVAPRLSNLENTISSLQGVSAGVRDTWLLAEAEYYMQVANAQLQLAGNPRIAALALNFADERIRQTANPALGEVRRELTQELQALEAMETADLEGMTLALASLAERVESLPLNENVEVTDAGEPPVDPELSGFSRAVASMKRAFSDVVSVRRTDEALTPLLSPDAAYFLRANLALQLQAARLALLKGEQGVFEQSLEQAAAWLREYYDADSRSVTTALQTISDLQDSSIGGTPPDISGSLRLLRQYRTLRNAESPGNGNTEEPAP